MIVHSQLSVDPIKDEQFPNNAECGRSRSYACRETKILSIVGSSLDAFVAPTVFYCTEENYNFFSYYKARGYELFKINNLEHGKHRSERNWIELELGSHL